MQKTRQTVGGKGNMGMFIERDPNICAAGTPSAQTEQTVAGCFNYYSLQDEVDALIQDSIKPDLKPCKLPPLRNHPLKDQRNAGMFTEGADLINPPAKTKFQILVEDCKETVYSSYWKKRVGSIPDPVPMLPAGFDNATALGHKPRCHETLYDVVMPKNPVPDNVTTAKQPGYQTDRKYIRPSFNPNQVFGMKFLGDPRGKSVKCCLSDDRIIMGRTNTPLEERQVKFINAKQHSLRTTLAPNNNLSNVPPGFSFGAIQPLDSESPYQMTPEKELFYKCLQYLNSLKKCFKKRFTAKQFAEFYLEMKYFDKNKTGWLPKECVYQLCAQKYMRLNPLLLEPLLEKLNAFDGVRLEYKTLIRVINHTEPIPEFPKVWDTFGRWVDFRTTYSEMVKPNQEPYQGIMAGLPSGKYFDSENLVTPAGRPGKARLSYDSEAKSCMNPSVFTTLGITQEVMYEKRNPAQIRKVFEAAGESLTDEKFNIVWNNAKKEHSHEWVCYETFRRALNKLSKPE